MEEQIKTRAEFFRALVHELKTPLTPVLSSSESIIAIVPDDMIRHLGENVYHGAERLNSRVDELLDIAKGEMGVLKVRCQSMNLNKLIRETVDYLQPQMKTNNQTLRLEISDSLPVIGDKERLNQVLLNLLNNSMKFTPSEGTITIRTRTAGDMLVVEVEDNGCGIDPAGQERLFQPYNRIESDRQYFSGLGLGLALCKQIIDLHGGRIWVNSQKGKGSTFSFSLQLAKVGDTEFGLQKAGTRF